VETKREMVKNLTRDGGKCRPPLKFVVTKSTRTQELRNLTLPDCVNHHTLYLFEALDISQDFLAQDPSLWQQNESYRKDKEILRGLQVVNDTAERGVALIKNFNRTITKREDDFQNLLLVRNISLTSC
jgi:hypothetical protein